MEKDYYMEWYDRDGWNSGWFNYYDLIKEISKIRENEKKDSGWNIIRIINGNDVTKDFGV